MAIGQLRLEYPTHGEIVATDGHGASLRADRLCQLFGGEDYDARANRPVDRPGFNADAWAPAIGVTGPGGMLRALRCGRAGARTGSLTVGGAPAASGVTCTISARMPPSCPVRMQAGGAK